MYADYNFYTTEYMVSLIPETAFTGIERAASAYIDYLTHNRIVMAELPERVREKVKMAVCAVAETCDKQMTDETPTVSSESVGNHSKSYAVVNKGFAERQHEKRYRDLLWNIENDLLFRRPAPVVWRCMNCGYLHSGTKAPDRCPSCDHERGYFEILAENW